MAKLQIRSSLPLIFIRLVAKIYKHVSLLYSAGRRWTAHGDNAEESPLSLWTRKPCER